jgi:hypothetical protein
MWVRLPRGHGPDLHHFFVAVRVTICDKRHLHIGQAVESKGRRCLARGYLLQDRRGHGGVEGGRLAQGWPDQGELAHRFSVGDARSVSWNALKLTP